MRFSRISVCSPRLSKYLEHAQQNHRAEYQDKDLFGVVSYRNASFWRFPPVSSVKSMLVL